MNEGIKIESSGNIFIKYLFSLSDYFYVGSHVDRLFKVGKERKSQKTVMVFIKQYGPESKSRNQGAGCLGSIVGTVTCLKP